MSKSMAIVNENYTILSQATAKIADSFVVKPNKIGTGSGEARLYVAPQGSQTEDFFTFSSSFIIAKGSRTYNGCESSCIISKDNFVKYMEDAKVDYMLPTVKRSTDISLFYDERFDAVNTLPDFSEFHVYNQTGLDDTERIYIGSDSYIWDLIREISLPKITTLTIYKLQSATVPHEIKYFFQLELNTAKSGIDSTSRATQIKTKVEEVENDTTISSTERTAIIKARKGQGKFRSNVLSLMNSCPFTGISKPALLRASHIIPWAECSDNNQRLDGYNGLALTPTYDTLFDLGLISFKNNGELLVSKRLTQTELTSLNLFPGRVYEINNNNGNRDEYLAYHRTHLLD